jgi:hypothetical protein
VCTCLLVLASCAVVLPGARREEINRRPPEPVDQRAVRRSHVESAGGGAEKYGGCLTGGGGSRGRSRSSFRRPPSAN